MFRNFVILTDQVSVIDSFVVQNLGHKITVFCNLVTSFCYHPDCHSFKPNVIIRVFKYSILCLSQLTLFHVGYRTLVYTEELWLFYTIQLNINAIYTT
jgi:hypothetical protein